MPTVSRPKGMRDFLPEQMNNRLHLMSVLRGVFERFGFEPLETPAMERIETLTGKYGDEGDKLIFRVLKRGEGGKRGEVDQALRYDLTVPLARVVAMHPALRMPFKRYQIQPVWRADRPQRGRFREFYQCDVDIVGTTASTADAECLAVVSAALQALGFSAYTIRLNDRRILRALAERVGADDQETGFLVAIDKLDKIGRDGVTAELRAKGIEQTDLLWQILEPQVDDESTLAHIEAALPDAAEAVQTLREVRSLAADMGAVGIKVDPTLARGLDYYTGPVFETVVDEPKIGSISGGGRYDGLVGMFSKREVPAVGVSLGFERILTVMEELGMMPERPTTAAVLVTVMGDDTRAASVAAAQQLRAAGVNTELYLGSSRLKAQFKYANARGFPFVVVIGEDEVAEGVVTLKNMREGGQDRGPLSELIGTKLA